MLLLEGGQGRGHLGNLSRHMETAPMLAAVVPTMCRSHHHRHCVLSPLLLDGGRCLPTYSALDDMDI